MGLLEDFQEYANKAKTLPPSTKEADKLILYGLYKQAMIGNVNTDRPGMLSPTDRAKWDAWKAVEGKTKEQAMTEYIAKVKDLLGQSAK
ncbi:hypothetical protein J1N35_003241 [Gossypium stocksii]|uniref:ACB domain-containing protein n=1 Tax=Gossypium stocksii TaxID=47602 RepID=A0A9D3WPJ9_9ROSI|nr:hypothetical protein J1N35_003241 [Gossypium stocksii]